jgi:hypothetical protein
LPDFVLVGFSGEMAFYGLGGSKRSFNASGISLLLCAPSIMASKVSRGMGGICKKLFDRTKYSIPFA